MKAMILAAGLGERMRPLTDLTPKPLLPVGGKPLIQWHIENLVAAGFTNVVINTSHLGEQIEAFLGDGGSWGCQIEYSREAQPLETAGGIVQALPLLGAGPFALVNGDVWCDYPLSHLRDLPMAAAHLAHLVLVDNPAHHDGDFVLEGDAVRLVEQPGGAPALTYAGIAVYRPEFFAGTAPGKLPLRPLLDAAIAASAVSGEHFSGRWTDVGTPQRLKELDASLSIL
ncbi:nucleotidyltransferase family protein [Halieaceae bacterium IMCC14734]|uniref:Nucleotidyltransferase family protein n=1 Tax=Candidatus Litorirhabdus singularis TaxID=2518993 RepID=A0ABT3TNP5_9GAMM|nr:nucleotidyltransferase family protein [Candidatus Litorirhabdus singularis]MCX2983356.1 nucleotidyltransferase family protein [Candidatus Litorirhabdus singularis]